MTEKGLTFWFRQLLGSGKTAVLVERIIHKIMEEKIDITSLLVVTFTNASASEMRERILDAIYKKLEEEPENAHFQKQITLLGKANICTIHAFCLEIIKNHFFEIEISPNFRIGDTAEMELLKQEIIEDIFEKKYLEADENFLKLLDVYTGYRGDEPLKELILKIYRYIQSSPFPEEWLEEKMELFHLKEGQDFSQTPWGKILLKDASSLIQETKAGLQTVKEELEQNPELEKFSMAILLDLEKLEELEANLDTWEKAYTLANQFSFSKWPVDRKITSNIKDEAKKVRDKINKKFNTQRDAIFMYSSDEAREDILEMYAILKPLQLLILEFSESFARKKREKNVIDFNDIEHLALKILTQKTEEGNYVATVAAKEYQKKLEEIAIDEYQDSNLVQEYILTAISRGNNIFMVGDVKQSIYKFRQARPELFLEKYRTYQLEENKQEEDDLKIQLFKNFRSRKNILDMTNEVFQNIMSAELGDIEYTEEEYLNLGANYEETEENKGQDYKTEIHLIDTKQELQEEDLQEESEQQVEEEENEERIENTSLEARFVAEKIQKLIGSKMPVYDKKIGGYREATYKDIVILLRTTSNVAPVYEKEMAQRGIPVFSDTSAEYLDSVEIQTIMAVLKIMDNPIQDIPLVTVLRSMIGGFSDNDLIEIRLVNRTANFYEAMLEAKLQVSKELKVKIEKFIEQLEKWRGYQEYLPLDELIWKIYRETGYYHYVGLMPNGELRQANLKMLFERAKQYEKASFKGLFQFINFIDKLKLSSGDLSAAKLIGENENVVRIMSIHKSKGLEFPVVFLCGTGKNFNFQDLNDSILLHQDLGLGPKYINYEKKIEYDTLAKEAIKRKMKQEIMAEEMRVLYVALTRAKEKLIITGTGEDIEKELVAKEKMLKNSTQKIPTFVVGSFKRYRDWLELVYLKEQGKEMNLQVHSKKEILENTKKEEKEETIDCLAEFAKRKSNKESLKEIEECLEWKYEKELATTMPSKVSVTKLKEMAEKERRDRQVPSEKETSQKEAIMDLPKFLREEKVSAVQRGTVMHLCLQRLNPRKQYTKEVMIEEIEEMVAKQMITRKEAESIRLEDILNFTKTKLWEEIQKAKKVDREMPFYMNLPAEDIYQKESEEKILVQGIIDLCYISEAGELILVDYKTDFVKEEAELVKKYTSQLELYKKALEEATGQEVKKTYIYSTFLRKEIELPIVT